MGTLLDVVKREVQAVGQDITPFQAAEVMDTVRRETGIILSTYEIEKLHAHFWKHYKPSTKGQG